MERIIDALQQIHPDTCISIDEANYMMLGKLAGDAVACMREMHLTIIELRNPKDVHRH